MTFYPSNINSRIKQQDLLLSTLFFSREFHIASAIYQTKPDWVWIDQEHAPWGTESIGPICIMARQAGVAGVIRVPWNSASDIKKAYDIGAVGVMVPQVDNLPEVEQAINYAKYPPLGERGIAPWFAAPMGIDVSEVIEKANQDTFLVLQMESVEAYENIDEILAVENFEVLLIGPLDLSASLGVPGQIHHPKVESIMRNVAEKMKGRDKSLATTFFDPQDARRWIAEGYRMMNVGTVLQLGTDQTKEIFSDLRAEFA
ncbi:MAG: 4-hydroxy-2-oxoheptanedioate aldolase [Chloroflexi bacterium]|jgi:4-hydroxy-2-oxoheptanedioate aldolase|nr:MAG: 4-hydroxy-2-oxoheptanedioate aldolase [Chloroflexota bacterium]